MAKKKTAKTKKRTSSGKRASKKVPQQPTPFDKSLRDRLLELLKGGSAHTTFDAAMGDWPVQLAGVKVANFPHTAWMLLEHLRIAQWDILEFSRNRSHKSPPWPEGYWPESETPSSEKAWTAAMSAFKKDLEAFKKLVADPKTDLYAKILWGDGQTVLREVLLVADHNAYHLGQLVMLRKCLGI